MEGKYLIDVQKGSLQMVSYTIPEESIKMRGLGDALWKRVCESKTLVRITVQKIKV